METACRLSFCQNKFFNFISMPSFVRSNKFGLSLFNFCQFKHSHTGGRNCKFYFSSYRFPLTLNAISLRHRIVLAHPRWMQYSDITLYPPSLRLSARSPIASSYENNDESSTYNIFSIDFSISPNSSLSHSVLKFHSSTHRALLMVLFERSIWVILL